MMTVSVEPAFTTPRLVPISRLYMQLDFPSRVSCGQNLSAFQSASSSSADLPVVSFQNFPLSKVWSRIAALSFFIVPG